MFIVLVESGVYEVCYYLDYGDWVMVCWLIEVLVVDVLMDEGVGFVVFVIVRLGEIIVVCWIGGGESEDWCVVLVCVDQVDFSWISFVSVVGIDSLEIEMLDVFGIYEICYLDIMERVVFGCVIIMFGE